jgi:hypothetical protein
MSTLIEWTDETWNPITGCDRISPGCNESRLHKAAVLRFECRGPQRVNPAHASSSIACNAENSGYLSPSGCEARFLSGSYGCFGLIYVSERE